MNRTLEAMARALFQSWFVDFDPVRAKLALNGAEGAAGLKPAIAALFPDRLVAVDGREMPEGWKLTTLGDVTAKHGGLIQTGPFGSQLHASDYVEAGIPTIMPKDISDRRVRTEKIAYIDEADAARLGRHRVAPGDIVYSRRGDVERHALIGKREQGWLCGTGCMLVRPGARWPSPLFMSLHLDRPDIKEWITQHAIGATMPNLNTSVLGQVPILAPSHTILKAFEVLAGPLDEKSADNDRQSAPSPRCATRCCPSSSPARCAWRMRNGLSGGVCHEPPNPKQPPRPQPGKAPEPLIPQHGGYRNLKSFQVAQLVYDVTVRFCDRYIEKRSRTHDQMVQAARSGVQNIAEGSQVSGTSKKMELKLTNVARASLEELRLDYEDFLRQRGLALWERNDPRRQALVARRCTTADQVAAWVKEIHGQDGQNGPDGQSILSIESIYPELSANAVLVLIGVACALLDRQIAAQAAAFEQEGGFTERLYRVRQERRRSK